MQLKKILKNAGCSLGIIAISAGITCGVIYLAKRSKEELDKV